MNTASVPQRRKLLVALEASALSAKPFLIALILLPTLFAESLSTFEVRELSPAIVQKIADADATLDKATKALSAAQDAVAKARKDREAIQSEVLNSVGVMAIESQCASTRTYSADGTSWPGDYERLFTRVEIRGKYALITAGKEACSGLNGVYYDNGITRPGITLAPYYDDGISHGGGIVLTPNITWNNLQ